MKRLMQYLLILCLLVISATAQKAIVTRNVYLRSDPSTDNPPITKLLPGAELQLIETDLGPSYLHVRDAGGRSPKIYSTKASTAISCWDDSLGSPGAVEIATTGRWNGKEIGLKGGAGTNFNHAKIGVSNAVQAHLAIFGDMNQQGTVSGQNCGSSQNGRGGLFYVVDDATLANSIGALSRAKLLQRKHRATEGPRRMSFCENCKLDREV